MKNRDKWLPTKFVFSKGTLIGSRDRTHLAVSSRLMADLVAARYENLLKEHVRGRLLDLGCGNVPLLAAYEAFVDEITCVDWENTLHKNEYLDLHCDLTQPLPFEADRFDSIILSDVLEHIPTPTSLWAEMARVLANGGKLLMNVPFLYWVHEAPHDYYRYTEFALRRFAEGAGLTVVLISPIGGAPEVIADVAAKTAERLPLVGRSLAILIESIARVFIRTPPGARLSRTTSSIFPYGYFLVAEKSLQRQSTP